MTQPHFYHVYFLSCMLPTMEPKNTRIFLRPILKCFCLGKSSIITLQSLYNIIYQKKSELHISFYSISFKENSVYSEVNALSYEQEKQFTSTTFYIKETK